MFKPALRLLLAAAFCCPISCGLSPGKDGNDSSLAAVEAIPFKNASQLFNFAHLVNVQPALEKLRPYVGPGEAYLFFGEKEKFRVETNLTVDANGGLSDSGSRYIRSDYYLDGYIFGRQLTDGSLIDMQAKANFNAMKLTGYVRFLGDDKYNGEIKVGIDKTFIRDLSYDKTIYGLPLLGVSVGATLGGELGFRAAPGLRADQALSASFEPHIRLEGTAEAKLTALKFLSARAEGSIEILDIKLSSTGAIGVVPESKFVYANMAMDGATVMALDGVIDLYAQADVSFKLPSGVNALLWSIVGIDPKGLSWHHTLWDPEPAYLSNLNRYGKSYIGFWSNPGAGAACQSQTDQLQSHLLGRLAALEKERNDDEYLSIIVSSNIEGLKEVLALATGYCANPGKDNFETAAPSVSQEETQGSAATTPGPSPTDLSSGTSSETGDDDEGIWGSGILDPW